MQIELDTEKQKNLPSTETMVNFAVHPHTDNIMSTGEIIITLMPLYKQ